MSKKLQVEIFVKEEWESSYSISRDDMDKVYKYMDLLQVAETGEVNLDSINAEIADMHENYNL